jgi:hypothetical protein
MCIDLFARVDVHMVFKKKTPNDNKHKRSYFCLIVTYLSSK